MEPKLLPLVLLVSTAAAVAQSSSFSYQPTTRITIDRAYHYRAEGRVEAQPVDVVDVSEFVADPAQRVASVPPSNTGGAAGYRWAVSPVVYLPHDPAGCANGLCEVLGDRAGSTKVKADNSKIQFTFGDAGLDLVRVEGMGTCTGFPHSPTVIVPARSRHDSWNSITSVVPFVLRQRSFVTSEFLQATLDGDHSPFVDDSEFEAGMQARIKIWKDENQNGAVDPNVDSLVLNRATEPLSFDQDNLVGPQGDRLPQQTVSLGAGRYLAEFRVDHVFNTRIFGNFGDSVHHMDTIADLATASALLTVATLSSTGTQPTAGGTVGN